MAIPMVRRRIDEEGGIEIWRDEHGQFWLWRDGVRVSVHHGLTAARTARERILYPIER